MKDNKICAIKRQQKHNLTLIHSQRAIFYNSKGLIKSPIKESSEIGQFIPSVPRSTGSVGINHEQPNFPKTCSKLLLQSFKSNGFYFAITLLLPDRLEYSPQLK
eukprot:TRINITY_DN136908_c1_g1_i1.p5 TRINITY_DN136908_c1_g1~~TRINITY_DN136908_c1_g1_i1.p5  ORF type:complete len:113 (-),score=1.71 TRINITY_DN136908_c1_g1_i1:983-1294(-)